jgi:hypothetical protein
LRASPNQALHRSRRSGVFRTTGETVRRPGKRSCWVPRPPSLMSEAVRPTDFVRGAIVGKLNPAGSGDSDGRVGIADQPLIPSTRLGIASKRVTAVECTRSEQPLGLPRRPSQPSQRAARRREARVKAAEVQGFSGAELVGSQRRRVGREAAGRQAPGRREQLQVGGAGRKGEGSGRRPTKRCSGAAAARFTWLLVRPFGGPAERRR